MSGCGIAILLATLMAGLFLFCPRAEAAPPSGYWKYGRDVAKEQQRVYGLRYWSSILLAQIHQESAWRRCPTSPAGARGLTQFMPGTQRAVERKYHLRGDICKPTYAAKLQAYLMKENAWQCATAFDGIQVWICSTRIYNGSPRSFWQEWVRDGRPSTAWGRRACVRRAAHCRENWRYPERILIDHWPMYFDLWEGAA